MNNDIVSLPGLAAAINQEHENCNIAILDGLQHAIKAGELLHQAKAQIQHGQWLQWLKDNVSFSERTAQNYIRVFQRKNELIDKSATVADLSYKAAINLLTEPKFPEYQVHELGMIFPFDEGAVNRIVSNMQDGGYWELFPITLYEGKILDGKLRYEAARRSGVIPTFEEYNGHQPLEFIKSRNLYRKHLTQDQIAALYVLKEQYIQKAAKATKEALTEIEQKIHHDEFSLSELVEIINKADGLRNEWSEFTLNAEHKAGEAINTYKALKEIKENQLFKNDYSTFEDYAKDKWGIDDVEKYMNIYKHIAESER